MHLFSIPQSFLSGSSGRKKQASGFSNICGSRFVNHCRCPGIIFSFHRYWVSTSPKFDDRNSSSRGDSKLERKLSLRKHSNFCTINRAFTQKLAVFCLIFPVGTKPFHWQLLQKDWRVWDRISVFMHKKPFSAEKEIVCVLRIFDSLDQLQRFQCVNHNAVLVLLYVLFFHLSLYITELPRHSFLDTKMLSSISQTLESSQNLK